MNPRHVSDVSAVCGRPIIGTRYPWVSQQPAKETLPGRTGWPSIGSGMLLAEIWTDFVHMKMGDFTMKKV